MGGIKAPLPVFAINFNKSRINLQNFLTLSFSPFATLVSNFKFAPSVMEMLQLPNFGHMNTSTIYFEPRDKIFLVTSSTEIMMSWPLIQNTVILRRPGVAIFAGIIKIVTRFIKQIFKDSRKGKGIRNYILKCNLYLYFLIKQNLLISGEKMLMSAKVRGVSRDSYTLWILFW